MPSDRNMFEVEGNTQWIAPKDKDSVVDAEYRFSCGKVKEEPVELDDSESSGGHANISSSDVSLSQQDSLLGVKEENDGIIENLPIHFDCSPTTPMSQLKKPPSKRGRKKGSKNIRKVLSETKSRMLIPKVNNDNDVGRCDLILSTLNLSRTSATHHNPLSSHISSLFPSMTQQQLPLLDPTTKVNQLNNTKVSPIPSQVPLINANTSLVSSTLENQANSDMPKIEQVFFTGWKKCMNGDGPDIGIPLPVPTSKVLINVKKNKVDVEKPKKTRERVTKPLLKRRSALPKDTSKNSMPTIIHYPRPPPAQYLNLQSSSASILMHPQMAPNQPVYQWPAGSLAPSATLPLLQQLPVLNATAPIRIEPTMPVVFQSPPIINVGAPNSLLISGPSAMPMPMSFSLNVNDQAKHCPTSLKPAQTLALKDPSQNSGPLVNCVTPVSIANQFIFLSNISAQQSVPQQTSSMTTTSSISTGASLPTKTLTGTQCISSSNISVIPQKPVVGIQCVLPVNNLGTNNLFSPPPQPTPLSNVINRVPSSLGSASDLLSSLSLQVRAPTKQTVLPMQGTLPFQSGLRISNLQGAQSLPEVTSASLNSLNLTSLLTSVTTATKAKDVTTTLSTTSSSSSSKNRPWNSFDCTEKAIECINKNVPVNSILKSLPNIKPKIQKTQVSLPSPKNINVLSGKKDDGANNSIPEPRDLVVNLHNKPESSLVDSRVATSNKILSTTVKIKSGVIEYHVSEEHFSDHVENSCSKDNTSLTSVQLSNLDGRFSEVDNVKKVISPAACYTNLTVCHNSPVDKTEKNMEPSMSWFADVQPKSHLYKTPTSSEKSLRKRKRKKLSFGKKSQKTKPLDAKLKLSFHGDLQLLNQALIKCTVSLERVNVAQNKIQEAIEYYQKKKKPHGENGGRVGVNENWKFKMVTGPVPRKKSKNLSNGQTKTPNKVQTQLKNKKRSNLGNFMNDMSGPSKKRKLKVSPDVFGEVNEKTRAKNKRQISFSDSSPRPSISKENKDMSPTFKEWVPVEVLGDLTIRGQMREYSLDDNNSCKTRRSLRIEQKPRMDYAFMEQGVCGEMGELMEESGDQEKNKDENESSRIPHTSKYIEKQKEREKLVSEILTSDKYNTNNSESSNTNVAPKDPENKKKRKPGMINDKAQCPNGESTQTQSSNKETADAKSASEDEGENTCHYSSESDSDLFDKQDEVTWYATQSSMQKVQHLMTRHSEVTLFLLKNKDKFSTFQGDKTTHFCEVCKAFKTNGLFRLCKHLKVEHKVN